MIRKIPSLQTKNITVTNGKTSYQGTIAYTKNINFDEEGYISLSAPMVNIYSSNVADGGDVNLDLPVDVFAYDGDGNYKVLTDDRAFNFNLGILTFSEDSGVTTYDKTSRVITWVSGEWFINADDVYQYDGSGGSATYTSRVNLSIDYLELFANRNSIVGSVGNLIKQYNTSFASTIDLTIPETFSVKGLSYSDNRVGVITQHVTGSDNANFFTWDGATTSANKGYPVNDSLITGIGAYKSSWAIITSSGELLYFNGGGFTSLGTLPSYYFGDDFISLAPGTTITVGKIINAQGDLVYVNCPSTPEHSITKKGYRQHVSGGVYCYDPAVGFYHRHAPSYSKYKKETGTSSSNIITLGTHYMETGDEVYLPSDDQGLTGDTVYFAIKVSTTQIKLASTYNNAVANTALTITDGSIEIWYVQRKDYGVESLRINDLGVCKFDRGYSSFSDNGTVPFFLGGSIRPNNVSSSREDVLNVLAPLMSNRGYLVTGRFQSEDITDTWQSVTIKYRQLSQQSSIIVKTKTKDIEPIIVGDETLFNASYTGPTIIWDQANSFSTTFDLSGAEIGDEVHVFVGAGSGQSAHIQTITQMGSSYLVILDENLRGITSLAKSCVCIDKFKKTGTITALDDQGFKKITIDKKSPMLEVKVEARGIGVRISEIQVNKITNEAGA